MGWRDKLCFLTPTFKESTVGGKVLKFYPCSVGLAFKLRRLGTPLVTAFSVLLADKSRDARSFQKTIADKKMDATETSFEAAPISIEMAQYRDKQRSDALAQAIEAISCQENLEIVAEIIIDSLRDDFPRGHADNPNPADFLKELPLPLLTEFVWGVVKANQDVLGPLAAKAGEAFKSLETMVQGKLATLKPSEEQPPAASVIKGSASKKNPTKATT